MRRNGLRYYPIINDERTDMYIIEKFLQIEPALIRFIHKPSYKEMRICIKSNPMVIKFIDEPPYLLQLMAVEKNPYAVIFIKNPDIELLRYSIRKDPSIYKSIDLKYKTFSLYILYIKEKIKKIV